MSKERELYQHKLDMTHKKAQCPGSLQAECPPRYPNPVFRASARTGLRRPFKLFVSTTDGSASSMLPVSTHSIFFFKGGEVWDGFPQIDNTYQRMISTQVLDV